MSTVVVARKGGFVAIGGDTLTTNRGIRESAAYIAGPSKLVPVGESVLAVVGHASYDLVLAHHFSRLAEPPALESPAAIFDASLRLHQALKDDYFIRPHEDDEDEFESSGFDCLIANPAGIFGLYSYRSVQEYTRFYAFGTGAEIALGAMHAVYESAESVEAVARAGLEAAADWDARTQRPLEIRVIPLRPAERVP